MTNTPRSVNALVLMLASGALAAPLAAQDKPVRGDDMDGRGVVMTPVDDLNIDGDEIPEVLREAQMDAYASEKLIDCPALERELARLDAVLGKDFDLAQDKRRRVTAGRVGKTVVASFIPFRGVLREISGAAGEARELEDAIVAGGTRRGYLKGLGEARGCAYPARPASVRATVSGDMPDPEKDAAELDVAAAMTSAND